ncbi:GNAT family N-acyltransferase [Acrocarpospora sp. B8E8]|uniref:GNAT family N-acyltransferase n=1 Tax=Acrocarpospora sp. B8E8 TaxID=3153572 RepID=UPI00325DF2B1
MMTFEVYPPCADFGAEAWHRELLEFRGRVLRSIGMAVTVDVDDHDALAYHLIARALDGAIAGAARLAPLEDLRPSRVLTLEPQASDILRRDGLTSSDVLEGGRWMVDERHRRGGVGWSLVLAGAVLSVRLGRKLAWVLAGTARGQDLLLTKNGFRAASDRVHAMPGVGDHVRLLTVRPDRLLEGQREPELDYVDEY